MRVGFTIKADSETAGFYVTQCGDNDSIGVPDDVAVYFKPLPGLKITGGTFFDDTLRNNGAAFGSWNWIRTGDGLGESFGFARLRGANQDANISYTMEGLYLVFMQAQSPTGGNLTKYGDGKDEAAGGLNNSSFAASYTVPNMVTIKAAKIGFANAKADLPGWTEAFYSQGLYTGWYQIGAVVKAVPNLTAEADLWIPTNKDNSLISMNIPVSGSYKMGAATINAFFDYLSKNSDYLDKNAMALGAGVDYDIGNGLTFNSDIRYNDKYFNTLSGADYSTFTAAKMMVGGMTTGEEKAKTSVFVGVTKALAVGSLGVGFQYNTLAFGTQYSAQDPTKAQWAIPVKWEVSF